MARADLSAILDEIRNPQTTQSHISALKTLKHDIIGHELRKEQAIRHGVVPLLVRNLQETLSRSQAASSNTLTSEREWTDGEEIRLQTAQIVACLAHGGLAFVQPLLVAGIVPPLISQLSPGTVPPRLLVETLRGITAIAEALAMDVRASMESSELVKLADQLFSRPTVDALAEILAQTSSDSSVMEQSLLLLKIICACLQDVDCFSRQQHQATLVKAGVLDLICSRLASLLLSMGHAQMSDSGPLKDLLPSPPRSCLEHLLQALASLCYRSAYRSMRILYSRQLLAIFPIISPTSESTANYLLFSDQAQQSLNSNPIDQFLPKLQAVQSKSEHTFSKSFPALGAFSNSSEQPGIPYFSDAHTMVSTKTISADEFGSPFIAWLIHIARHSTALERMAALELLAILISALDQKIMESWTDSSRNRDRTLAFLVVPLLVRIIDSTDPKNLNVAKMTLEEFKTVQLIRERAPWALATLIYDAPALQKAAHDSSAINILGAMLKRSFDAISVNKKSMWSATSRNKRQKTMTGTLDPACTLGEESITPGNLHRYRCRAASLLALSAIAQKEDIYRKQIIEINIVSCLVDSLTPYSDDAMDVEAEANTDNSARASQGKDGNPWFVIVAACRLAQALSRSVSVLRTKLLDAGIAKPVFTLLTNPDRRIKSAGTDAVTNLLLQFSPMREELLSQGIVKVLCSHAHSADSELRMSALWALKHLCASTPNDIKINIVEELGTGWLITTMWGESLDSHPRSHMASSNAAGERVDLLNEVDEPAMDIDAENAATSSSDVGEEDLDDEPHYNAGGRSAGVPTQYRARLRAIRHAEENPAVRAKRNDIKIQAQALNLVRNLISEAGASQPGMIDNLLQAFGSSRLFECLASKLKPRLSRPATGGKTTTHPGSSSTPAGKRPTLTTPRAARRDDASAQFARVDAFPTHLYPDTQVMLHALFTLIHIANGRPHHRHMLLALVTSLSPSQDPSLIFPPNIFPPQLLPQRVLPNADILPPNSAGITVPLLSLLLPLYSHSDPRIRVACCWMAHNIMWTEDEKTDGASARARARELAELGFEDAVQACASDTDNDVKERAKGCLIQFSAAKNSSPGDRERERQRRDEVERGLREGIEGRSGGGRSWER